MKTKRFPTTYAEYVDYYELVPRDAGTYLRKYQPDSARQLDLLRLSPIDLAARLARARRAAAGALHPPRRGAAPARRASSSAAVRVAAAIDEVKNGGSSSPGILAGYAAMFNRPSVPLPFTEVLAPGAFRSTLEQVQAGKHDVLAFTEHDRRNILGRVAAGNLKLAEDARGLRFTLELPDTQLGRDTRELVRRGILRGMSFSFAVVKESWAKGEGGQGRRTVHDLLAYEISIVGTPAYPATSVVAARSLDDALAWRVATLRAMSANPVRLSRRFVPRASTGSVEHR